MPQINQLAEVAYSQFFWLLLVLGLIYFGIGHFMLPKIQSTVGERDKRIADDLAAAQAAREAADRTEEAYRARIDASRAEAFKLAAAAKQKSAAEAEKRIAKANASNEAKIEAAQKRIREASEAARQEVEEIAAEAVQEMIARLTGLTVPKQQAAEAVKAELANG